MSDVVNVLANIALAYIGVVLHTFVVRYVRRSNWRATDMGRGLLVSKVSLALLVDLVVVSLIMSQIFGPDWPGKEWVRLGVYGLIAVGQTLLLRALGRALRRPAAMLLEDGERVLAENRSLRTQLVVSEQKRIQLAAQLADLRETDGQSA